MTVRWIKAVGLSSSDQVLFRSMLGLVPGRTTDIWRLSDEVAAPDVLVLGDPPPDGERSGTNGPRPSLRAVVAGAFDGTDIVFPYPLRPRSLVEFLNDVSVRLDPATRTDRANQLAFADLLYQHVRTPMPDGRLAYSLIDGELLTIDTARGRCAARSATRAVESAGRRDVLVRQSTAASASGPDVHWMPLMPLLWEIGLAYRQALVAPVTPDDDLIVRRWPDFGQLGHRSDHLRMTALMIRQPMSVAALAARAGVAVELATGFANAMLLIGHARVGAAAQPSRPRVPAAMASAAQPQRLGLLQRIRSRLGL